MRIFDDIYALIKGMITVGVHLFRPAVTVQYPEQRDSFNSRLRGQLALRSDKEGNIACIGCRSCIRVCPCKNVLSIESRKEGNRVIIEKFEIDTAGCILCGNCVFVCPKNVLMMTSSYENASEDKKSFLKKKEDLLIIEEEKE